MSAQGLASAVSGFCGIERHGRCPGAGTRWVCACDCHSEPPAPAIVAVHCFFGCEHVARDEDPRVAHATMEEHYRAVHWERIRELVGWAA